MDEKYWDRIFEEFSAEVGRSPKRLPSVSIVASQVHSDPYAVLVSTILSLRTKDEVTLAASKRLLEIAPDIRSLDALDEETIQSAIYPAGFYKRKAGQLKAVARAIIERFDGQVPSCAEDLMSLPGVGIKTANLTLNLGFGIPAICVDCHVHQIANRMGWISTKTPEESVKALEAIMPERTDRPYACPSPRCAPDAPRTEAVPRSVSSGTADLPSGMEVSHDCSQTEQGRRHRGVLSIVAGDGHGQSALRARQGLPRIHRGE